MNSNQTATYCSLVKQSKRATSVGEVVGQRVTGDLAMPDRVWTSVVAREHIVVEIRKYSVNREQTNIGGTPSLRKGKRNGKQQPTNSLNFTRLFISVGIIQVSLLPSRYKETAQTVKTNHKNHKVDTNHGHPIKRARGQQ
jgi:hypothetical protein